ncbi:MAG: hypothetical protein LUD46_16790 [Parabacteroides sp.]|nr:hypothetical protein [Parabacteroides sp.]
MLPCTYPFYDGKYGAPEGPEDDPQSHNPLWDMANSSGYDKYTQIYTDWCAQVKFLKHFTYNFDFYYKDLRCEKKTVNTSIGKYSFSKGAYSTGAADPATLYTYMFYTRENTTKMNHLINYNQSFGAHDVSAMIGYEEQTYKYRETDVSKLGLTDASVNDLNAAQHLIQQKDMVLNIRGGQYSVVRIMLIRVNICLNLIYAMMVLPGLLPITAGEPSPHSRSVGV